MDLSFIILTWNSGKYIDKCLSSVAGSLETGSLSYEILVVDNGSQDNTVATIEAWKDSKVRIIKLDRNRGTTYPRNLAVKRAKGRFICIMDSDIEIFSKTVESLLAILQKDTSIGLVVPKLVYPDGSLQKSTDRFPTILRKAYRYFFLKKIEARERNKKNPGIPIPVDYAISALWITRKTIYMEVGLLDEKIFYSPEDVDFCLRIWKAGYKILYDQRISAIHHTQEISRGFKINKAFFSHIKGLCYYFIKHRYFFSPPAFGSKS